MTCAHVVHVALKKLPGVDTADVSLNKGLATVKLKSDNSLSIAQFWQTIHQNGYTPKRTVVSVRGDVSDVGGQLNLKVSGTNEVITLVADPKNTAAYKIVQVRVGQKVTLHGTMAPLKDLKIPVPLQVDNVE